MILYLFISCQKLLDNNYNRIQNMMKKFDYNKYVIITGGHNNNEYDEKNKRIKLNCSDTYEGLPEKMIKIYKYILNNEKFNDITYICKLDEDMIIKKILDTKILQDYYGKVCYGNGNRKWHIGKCSTTSKFNKTEYKGKYVHWCLGGYGYILSTKILKLIKNNTDYENEIYEDLYIAKILNKNKIYPKNFKNIKNYFISPEHK